MARFVVDAITFSELQAIGNPVQVCRKLGMLSENGSAVFDFLTDLRVDVQDFGTHFVPPRDRFVEYEASDHGWLMALGMGSWEPVRAVMMIEAPTKSFNPLDLLRF